MARTDTPCLNRSLAEKAYDFLGDILLQAETEEMLEEIEQEKADGNTAEMDAFFARQDAHHLKQIQQYFRKQSYKHFFTTTLPKIVQIASVFIATIALAGSVAIATSRSVRVHVMQLLYQIDDKYTSLQMEEDEAASFDVPVQWQGESFPSYLPPDLYITNIVSNWSENIIQYQSSTSPVVWLNFTELGPTAVANIDTEDAHTEEITIQGRPGILSIKNQRISLCWADNTKYYMLVANGYPREQIISIADSVKRIH